MAPRSDDDQTTWLALSAGRGDPAALEQFIRATQQDVWRSVAYLGDPTSADDLTQETFLRAISALPRFTGRSSARTWLLSIARRVVVDQIRHRQRRPRAHYSVDVDKLLESRRPARGFEDIVEIRVLLDGLETDRKHALLLTQVLGLSYAEAAQVCGCPVGTIRSRVARAREDLLNATREGDLTG
ncbi:RNA polymerase sigma factor SigC [Mycobacterium hubeiense]|uniref:RNA polymerase sigma factor SigC n=1 Tax=Mycobacterium hubeiense TaxID=1867256 RepID=UPI000C7EB9AB|nr:RNA polymerase sigma factor SigC [Mycobacterium sp. QGD 101]